MNKKSLEKSEHGNQRTYKFPRWAANMYARNARRPGGVLVYSYQLIVNDESVRQIIQSGSILDIGCGPGKLILLLAENNDTIKVTGLDYSPAMVSIASKKARELGLSERASFTEGNVLVMPFPDESFDAVISSFSLHEWPSIDKAIMDILRVVKHRGKVLLFSATASIEKEDFSRLKKRVGLFDAIFIRMITGACKKAWDILETRLNAIGAKVSYSTTLIDGFIKKLVIEKNEPEIG